ncbi:MAG TPA: hypothetical protein VFO60_11615, partial [Candidatus Dormibacteraeota bacterium]|nr:hypothetical protein [Candidatus Dormibacteraeota bacterium]
MVRTLKAEPLVEAALRFTYAHPRLRVLVREGWGVARAAATRAHAPALLEPASFEDLRRLRASSAPAEAGPTSGAPRVLFLSMRGWSTHLMYETVLARAVAQRGAAAVFATCGGRLPVCDLVPGEAAPPMPCHSCRAYTTGAISAAGFDPLRLRDLVDVGVVAADARERTREVSSVSECAAFHDGDLPMGEFVRVSTAWFLSRGSLPEDAAVVETYRRFLVSGMVVAAAFRSLLDRVSPDRIFLLNGSLFAERILRELAAHRGVPVVTYEKGFLLDTILVAEGAAASDVDPGADAWLAASEVALSAEENRRLDDYLHERTWGGRTFDNFWVEKVDDIEAIRRDLDLRPGRRLVVLFSNILWDSAVQGKDLAFGSMPDWVVSAIRWAATRPDLDLVVRLHPAEIRLANHPT